MVEGAGEIMVRISFPKRLNYECRRIIWRDIDIDTAKIVVSLFLSIIFGVCLFILTMSAIIAATSFASLFLIFFLFFVFKDDSGVDKKLKEEVEKEIRYGK